MNRDSLKQEFEKRCISLTDLQLNQLFNLMKSTFETNEKFNLTAIKEESTFIEKMIFDSGLVYAAKDLSNKKILDLGTGAGFPGMVLYILNPSIKITLLDSTKKKIDYLREYCASNNFEVDCVCDRAENFARNNREKFDYVTARAVSELSILMELSMPMLKVGGELCALKSLDYENEVKVASNAFKKLNCHLDFVYKDELPDSKEFRSILFIKKDKETNLKYPRDYALIKERKL